MIARATISRKKTITMQRFEHDWKALDIADLPANQQARLAFNIKRGDVSSVMGMIVQTADLSWGKLPPHTRAWNTKEEWIAAGVAHTVTHVAKMYHKTRGVKFSTYLQTCLTNFYHYHSEPMRAKERWEGETISIERDFVKVNNRYHTTVEFYLAHTMRLPSPEMEVISRIDAVRKFMKVYHAATPNLRKYLIKWFLTSKMIRMREGEEYRSAQSELALLAPEHGFQIDMAVFLATNDQARAEAAMLVVRNYRTGGWHSLHDCPERDALPTAAMAVQ